MIKGSIQEEDITIINIYAPNTGALQYVRQMLTSMKGEINKTKTSKANAYTEELENYPLVLGPGPVHSPNQYKWEDGDTGEE